jgi:hypothetical protein
MVSKQVQSVYRQIYSILYITLKLTEPSTSLVNLCCLWLCFFDMMPSILFHWIDGVSIFLCYKHDDFCYFLISGTVYPSSLSSRSWLYTDYLSSSIIRCKRVFSSVVSILMRNVSLIFINYNSKLKMLW